MTKEQAIHQYWNKFVVDSKSIKAYDENTVPQDAAMPYITYEVAVGSLGANILTQVDIWGRGTAWTEVTKIAETICNTIGMGGDDARYDGGRAHIMLDDTHYRRTPDDNSDIRHLTMNIITEFQSEV